VRVAATRFISTHRTPFGRNTNIFLEEIMRVKTKRRGLGLDVRTFLAENGEAYVVFRTARDTFHTFQEVEAKEAARQCGGPLTGTTQQMWKKLWSTR